MAEEKAIGGFGQEFISFPPGTNSKSAQRESLVGTAENSSYVVDSKIGGIFAIDSPKLPSLWGILGVEQKLPS